MACFKPGQSENNALTLDISCMVEKHQEDDEKNLQFLASRLNKKSSSYHQKAYSPTEEWQEKGCYDTDKEGYRQLWITEGYSDPFHYFVKDVRDKRAYLKQQHNSHNRHHQAQVSNSRYHYHNAQKQYVPSAYSRTPTTTGASIHHVQVSSGGTTYYRPIVKNRYQWVRSANTSPTIAA